MKILEDIVDRHEKVAFLVGNGPNINAGIMPSWKELLMAASEKPLQIDLNGLSNTEIYDLVELYSTNPEKVKARVANQLEVSKTTNLSVHYGLMQLAMRNNIPVLTTNFDPAFEASIGADLIHLNSKGFTRYYPWKTYYGFEAHKLPTDGFGIWKVHGDVKYKDSIRLGLTDYMGSVERARRLIHKGDTRLFNSKNQHYWQGHETWLHIWFNLPIVIFGLSFGADEVFLRWLLIERRRYLNLYEEPMQVYFVSKGEPKPNVKNLMQNLGGTLVSVDSYDELYGPINET